MSHESLAPRSNDFDTIVVALRAHFVAQVSLDSQVMENLTMNASAESKLSGFALNIPPTKMLTAEEEAELYHEALRRAPDSVAARRTLVSQLLLLDRFAEAVACCESAQSEDFPLLAMWADALLSLETTDANRACVEVCRRALLAADSPRRQAVVLALLGKAQTRLGQPAEARTTLDHALLLDPGNKDAWKRAATLALAEGRGDEVLRRAEELTGQGVRHARIVAAQSLALAQRGEIAQAQRAQGLERYLRSLDPAPPAGWATMAKFTDELAAELATHPGLRFGRYGRASMRSWRIDQPRLKRLRVFPHLQKLIRREILNYINDLPAGDQPFLNARPQRAELRDWVVVTEGEGHEAWHVHQNGWISGTFYIQVPDHIAHGSERDGCIAFGLPETIVGQENADRFGERLCRPHAGLMMIFPSHSFHRTYPHRGAGRRICYAFDVIERTEISLA